MDLPQPTSQEQTAPSTEVHALAPSESETSHVTTEEETPHTTTTETAETAELTKEQEPKAEVTVAADACTETESAGTQSSKDTTEAVPAAPETAPKTEQTKEPEKQEEEQQSDTTAAEKEGETQEPSATTTTSTATPDPRANWVPDDSAAVCSECGSEFTFMRRRHHCRVCGRLFCGDCTQQTFELPPQYGWKGPQRVCESCYLILYSRKQLGVSPAPK